LGGGSTSLRNAVGQALRQAGFSAHTSSHPYPGSLAGNICNRAVGGAGVQLELSEGLRKSMFTGLDRASRRQTLPLFDQFVQSIQPVLFHMEDSECRKYL
jgi:phage replication-related protein YjqB (UPF0714/DUF867 family)